MSEATKPIDMPGSIHYSKALEERIHRALADKKSLVTPRTRHLDAKGNPIYTNRLIFEVSPYLLQHAHNPVNWYPWGEEAFNAAREGGKLIFLSIGYSTCHWCHVMEEESFDDIDVARMLNEHFIAIKVDREERPDIDNVYMEVCRAMTGSGGWPLTIIMTPDRRPVFAGTYFPKTSRYGRPGLMDILPGIADTWKKDPGQVNRVAQRIVSALNEPATTRGGVPLSSATLDSAFSHLSRSYDPVHGGFGRAPKFPTPHNLTFLLRYWKRTGTPAALEMVEKTLTSMRMGGIYDQVGFGFHRYSTDPEWLVPHFEKMLYDQALIACAYIEAYQATGREDLGGTAREIFEYVLRDMRDPGGGFYSAEDADSKGGEGRFYLWTAGEIKEVLGEDEGRFFSSIYNVEEGGNAPLDSTGLNILHLDRPLRDSATKVHASPSSFADHLEADRERVFEARNLRAHPFKDDKVIAAWNGLMISALARGYQVFGDLKYLNAAEKAADFILGRMTDDSGRLIRRYRNGISSLPAQVNDYAFVVQGLLDLYEASFEVRYLQEAIRLNGLMAGLFWDKEKGAFFFTGKEGEKLLLRRKEAYDGALPSGNSIASMNLLRLWRITSRTELEEMAEKTMDAFSGEVATHPYAYTQFLCALDFRIGPSYEVVIAGRPDTPASRAMVHALQRPFMPNKIVIFRPTGEERPGITDIAGYTASQTGINGQATAYVCRDFACKAPTTDPSAMLASMGIVR